MYDGEWKDNTKHGHGVFAWANGNKYEGPYVNDRQHGEGKVIRQDGTIDRGVWTDGKWIKWL